MTAHLPLSSIVKDFKRDVWCLFGLPVDNLTMESTKRLIREKVQEQGNCVLSTINVNWVVQSMKDPVFQRAIINSDIVTIDGRPLIWLAKLLGYPMKEVVAGSSLIEELLNEKDMAGPPLTLYLFGGEDGVASQAMEQLNHKAGGLRAVGFCSPGFGSVEQLSSKKIIDDINAAKPDILLVALGAKKGTQWIEHNRNILEAKIICHLGATINFLAGTVVRSPKILQKVGLEWVWRILQEPKLAQRYLNDGIVLSRFIFFNFWSWMKYLCWKRKFDIVNGNNWIRAEEKTDCIRLVHVRNFLVNDSESVRETFLHCVIENKALQIDFQSTQFVDGYFLGLLLVLVKYQGINCKGLQFINLSENLRTIFCLFQFQKICRVEGL